MEVIKEHRILDARLSSPAGSSSAASLGSDSVSRRRGLDYSTQSASTSSCFYSLPPKRTEERRQKDERRQERQQKQKQQHPEGLYRLDATLHYKNLGKTGLRVSRIGLGTWVTFAGQITDSVADDLLTLAYACGINLFDTAEVYASGRAEELLGRLLQQKPWRRSSYIISTKIHRCGRAATESGLSRKRIVEGLLDSLQRLRVSYVDLVFASRPDSRTPMEEIVRAFTFCINQGWTFYWGTSRWTPTEIMAAHSVARQFNLIPPSAEQVEYNLFQRDNLELKLTELQSRLGLGAVAFSPLACGILTGKYEDGVPVGSRGSIKGYSWLRDKILSEEGVSQQATLSRLIPLAEQLNCSLAQLAIAWCLSNQNAHCILLGASCAAQLYENILAVTVEPRLTPEIMAEIDGILGNKPRDHSSSKSLGQDCPNDPSSAGIIASVDGGGEVS